MGKILAAILLVLVGVCAFGVGLRLLHNAAGQQPPERHIPSPQDYGYVPRHVPGAGQEIPPPELDTGAYVPNAPVGANAYVAAHFENGELVSTSKQYPGVDPADRPPGDLLYVNANPTDSGDMEFQCGGIGDARVNWYAAYLDVPAVYPNDRRPVLKVKLEEGHSYTVLDNGEHYAETVSGRGISIIFNPNVYRQVAAYGTFLTPPMPNGQPIYQDDPFLPQP